MQPFRAYAKINLGLLVLEKRSDGYHNIETVFHRVNLFDEITLSPSPELLVRSSSAEAPGDERNICFKAAKLIQEHLGVHAGVSIAIQKNIPVGAGLGGGSSDGAAVLRRLPEFWGEVVGEETLHAFAVQLGADVAYFLKRGSALAKGRGENLEYFELDVPYSILLCNPRVHLPTEWAYQHVKPRLRSVNLRRLVEEGMRDPHHLSQLTNDFEPSVFKHHPVVEHVKEMMLDNGAVFSLMSGSGSTVYGLFDDEEKARETAAALGAPGFATFWTEPRFAPSDD